MAVDLIATQVLKGVYDGLSGQPPIVIPTDLIASIAGSLTGANPKVIGSNLSSDADLKLGFKLDIGSATTFSPETLLTHHPADDWGLDLDAGVVATAIAAKARASVTAND